MSNTGHLITVLPPPNGYLIDLSHPQRRGVPHAYWVAGVGMFVSLLFMGQRLYTKLVIIRIFQLDDALLVLAWIFCQIGLGLGIHMFAQGACGVHGWEMSPQTYSTYLVDLYAASPIYFLCCGCGKLSLLIFYLRLSPEIWFKIASYLTLFLLVGYTISAIGAQIFQCHPTSLGWNTKIKEGACINRPALYISFAALNIFSDLILFCLPLPVLYRVGIHWKQKVALLFIFFIGSMTLVTSILRIIVLPVMLNTHDYTWEMAWVSVLCMAEGNLVVICASLPTTRKFLSHVAPRLVGENVQEQNVDALNENGRVETIGSSPIQQQNQAARLRCGARACEVSFSLNDSRDLE